MRTYTCEICGVSFTAEYRANRPARRFCGHQCSGTARRKHIHPSKYKLVWAPHHPLTTHKAQQLTEHRAILWEKIGPGPHTCHRCGAFVTWVIGGTGTAIGELIVDHINRNKRDNAPNNLAPSCRACNGLNHDTYRNAIQDDEPFLVHAATGHRYRAVKSTCINCGKEFIGQRAKRSKPASKYCSRQCYFTRTQIKK